MIVGQIPTVREVRLEIEADGLTNAGRCPDQDAADFVLAMEAARDKIVEAVREAHEACQAVCVTEQPGAVESIHMPPIDDTLSDMMHEARKVIEQETGIWPVMLWEKG